MDDCIASYDRVFSNTGSEDSNRLASQLNNKFPIIRSGTRRSVWAARISSKYACRVPPISETGTSRGTWVPVQILRLAIFEEESKARNIPEYQNKASCFQSWILSVTFWLSFLLFVLYSNVYQHINISTSPPLKEKHTKCKAIQEKLPAT